MNPRTQQRQDRSMCLPATSGALLAVITATLLLTGANVAKAAPIISNLGSVTAIRGTNTELFLETVSSELDVAVGGSSGGYTASATASTLFRSNRATASALKTNEQENGFSSASATSMWRDDIIVSNSLGLGLTVPIELVFRISGIVSGPTARDASAAFSFDFDVEDETSYSDSINLGWFNPVFLNDEEFTLIVDAEVNTLIGIVGKLTVSAGVDVAGLAIANFGATAILAEVILPPGVTIQSASGTDYMIPAVVPLPAAVWLFVSGLVALLGFSRRKQGLRL